LSVVVAVVDVVVVVARAIKLQNNHIYDWLANKMGNKHPQMK